MVETSPYFIASLEADIARGARLRRSTSAAPGGAVVEQGGARMWCGPIIGIDPGVAGALCLLRPDGSSDLRDIPTLDVKPRRILDLHALAAILREWADENPTVWIELVGPRPTDGSVAAFSFGGMWWGLKAMAAAYAMPLETVSPIRWRRAMGLGPGAGKDESRARASALLPRMASLWPLKGHDGRAEAALIALYGQRQAAAHQSPMSPPADARATHHAGLDGDA